MLSSKSRWAFSISAAVTATFIATAVSAGPAQATTGYGSASTIARGGFDPAVLSETDSSSVVVAGLDRSINDGDSTALVANEASSNSTGASSNTTSAVSSTSTSTSRSTVNGVPVVSNISATVNRVPATMQNITTSGGNSTSVSISTSTRCSSSSGCTTTTTTGSPSTGAASQIAEERNSSGASSGASSGEGVPAPVITPTPVSIAPSSPETPALLPDVVRAVAL